jgi:hypothetical protein
LNAAGFDPLAEVYFGPKFDTAARTGDLNGDGVADLLLFACVDPSVAARGGSPSTQFRNTSSADFGEYSALSPDAPNSPNGVNDTPCRQVGTRTYWVAAAVEAPLIGDLTLRASQCVGGGSLPNACTNTRSIFNSASFVDLNGDSYADIWINKKAAGGTMTDPNDQYSYRMNRGGNVLNAQLLPEAAIGLTLRRRFASKLNLADLNGDKRIDVLYQDDANIGFGTYPVRAKLQSANGFSDIFPLSGSPATFGNLNPDLYIAFSMDLDGDGGAELIRYKQDGSSSQNLYLAKALPRYGGNDFIVKFTNGFNVEHSVSYAPLVSKFTYERAYDGPRLVFAGAQRSLTYLRRSGRCVRRNRPPLAARQSR